MQIGDRVTVLRDGKLIGCKNLHTEKVTIDDIISMMVGHSMEQQFPKQQFEKGEELLRVENLSCGKRFQDVSFSLHKGEVLCFAGLVGAGRTEVAKTIFGALPKRGGRFIFKERKPLLKIRPTRLGSVYLWCRRTEKRKDFFFRPLYILI